MKSQRRLLLGTTLLLVALFAAGAYLYQRSERTQQEAAVRQNQEKLIRSYSPTLGPKDAPVTIVEFLDPECEACGAFHPAVKAVMKEFEGKVRLVIRYMPFHGNSLYVASVLEAVKQRGKYWEALDKIFARQSEWASHHDPKPELILGYMEELGLDRSNLEHALNDFVYRSRVEQDKADGLALGVQGTPTFFVNGKRLERLGYEPLREAVRAALGGE